LLDLVLGDVTDLQYGLFASESFLQGVATRVGRSLQHEHAGALQTRASGGAGLLGCPRLCPTPSPWLSQGSVRRAVGKHFKNHPTYFRHFWFHDIQPFSHGEIFVFSFGESFHLARLFTWREFLLGKLVCDRLSIDFLGPDLDLQFEFRV
jgi:hypothetical protein